MIAPFVKLRDPKFDNKVELSPDKAKLSPAQSTPELSPRKNCVNRS